MHVKQAMQQRFGSVVPVYLSNYPTSPLNVRLRR